MQAVHTCFCGSAARLASCKSLRRPAQLRSCSPEHLEHHADHTRVCDTQLLSTQANQCSSCAASLCVLCAAAGACCGGRCAFSTALLLPAASPRTQLAGVRSPHMAQNCVAKTVYAATVRVSTASQAFHAPAEEKGAKGPKVQPHRGRSPHEQQPPLLC